MTDPSSAPDPAQKSQAARQTQAAVKDPSALRPETDLVRVIGAASAKVIQQAFGYTTAGELLMHLPRRYVDVGEITPITALALGEDATVVATVTHASQRRMHNRRGFLLEVEVEDQDPESAGRLRMTFFNGFQAAKELLPGARAVFSGQVEDYRGQTQLSHPEYTLLGQDDEAEARPFPVYPSSGKLSQLRLRRTMATVLDGVSEGGFPDPVPGDVRARRRLPGLVSALESVHRPRQIPEAYAARRRFAFEEALLLQTVLAERRLENAGRSAVPRPGSADGLLAAFDAALPFTLTQGQVEVGAELARDLARPHPMNRLVQGEVGSGKTLVALRAMLQVIDSGGQAAMLAPTEVLASQHAATLRRMLGELALAGQLGGAERATTVELLTGSLPAARRREVLLNAASGRAGIVVGTHALLGDQVQFAELGLVVVDEQHRFGVEQRDKLRGGGEGDGQTPHTLVMTATPIPRTVAMTVFGDVETSILKGLPANRAPVRTFVVPVQLPAWRERLFSLMREQIDAGHQAYVVVPRITEDPAEEDATRARGADQADAAPLQRTALETMEQVLRAHPALQGVRIGTLHGKLAAEQKAAAMADFESGRTQLLLATTVVEVGVDVANATVMAIIDAESFGISQLHQLRGRIGRGGFPGTCLLVTTLEHEHPAVERLEAVAATSDGFELAEKDLETRREGDILGASQSGGRSTLKILRVMRDAKVIAQAREDAAEVVVPGWRERHPHLAAAVEARLDTSEAAYLERG
ncbi:ATP-dependent DNA helicase RecG [Galactobacter caseinivorans]|uniref:Probable DNA 3'-5' helicase RecG n=1 Tax=Galactobacter caseinivorans TaxID=2676123 RepID=A0A496PGR1_9MICC|nr:ATP-dependent DNA helicase RecG [Galactobacter caseinivorans]RKW69672.1 ATP-dependent DNA helicase RecG [Galactobacter caseinivorans]